MPGRHGQCKRFGQERQSRWLIPSLLYLLSNEPSHGYSLMNDLPAVGFMTGSADPGAVYRRLNMLEENGFVSSEWDTEGSGPAKRLYRITKAGIDHLIEWADFLKKRRDALDLFLTKIESLNKSSL